MITKHGWRIREVESEDNDIPRPRPSDPSALLSASVAIRESPSEI